MAVRDYLKEQLKEQLDELLDRLTDVVSPGDDGDVIRLALDEIAAVVGRITENSDRDFDALKLTRILERMGLSDERLRPIDRLIELASETSYGEGLHRDQVHLANELALEVAEIIRSVDWQ